MRTDLRTLLDAWREAKDAEEAWKARRRDIEDELSGLLPVPHDGARTVREAGHKIVMTARTDHKVDTARLRALAQDHGVEAELDQLFRWTADLRLGEWKRADPALTSLLAPAVTTKPGRVSWAVVEDGDAAGAADAINNGGAGATGAAKE